MTVHQAFRFALDPTVAQGRALASHCGAARFAFHWGLDLVKAQLEVRTRARPALTRSSGCVRGQRTGLRLYSVRAPR